MKIILSVGSYTRSLQLPVILENWPTDIIGNTLFLAVGKKLKELENEIEEGE